LTEFSWRTRRENLTRLDRETFDIAIIGGGITGAGLALDAVLRGLNTVLIEKRDFSAGTSSRSTKLIHGGLRYLEHYDFAMVREGLRERAILTRIAPHLAEPFPFLVPVYRESRRNYSHPILMRAGMILYSLLAGRFGPGRHRKLSRAEALEYAPGLDPEGLEGALLYYDGLTNDSRLVIDLLKSAHREGACLINHVKVTGLIRNDTGRLTGLTMSDQFGQSALSCRARSIINATGVWMEETLRLPGGNPGNIRKSVRPSKGVHLTIAAERLPVRGAWLIPSLVGHRFYFVVPWEGRVNIGTTDTDYDGSRETPHAVGNEVTEILAAINSYFPGAMLEPADVITSWAGLRPLISDPGVKNTTDISRQEEVIESADGLISIAGGKLTTYRLMAENGIDLAQKRLFERGELEETRRAVTTESRLCGGDLDRPALAELACRMADENELPLATAEHLVFNYGSEAPRIIELSAGDESLRRPLLAGLPHIAAEALYAVRYEMAMTLTDVMTRRTRLAMLAGSASLAAVEVVTGIIGRELGLGPEELQRQIEEYRAEIRNEYETPVPPGTSSTIADQNEVTR
jgi:glycerol-3-phosphate dehydrogenase